METLRQVLSAIGLEYHPSKSERSSSRDASPVRRPKGSKVRHHKHRQSTSSSSQPKVTRLSVGWSRDLLSGEWKEIYLSLKPTTFYFVGDSGSGKTTDLLAHLRAYADVGYYKFGICFSPSAHASGHMSCLPQSEIHYPDLELLTEHIEGVMALAEHYRIELGKPPPANYIILDDCTNLLGNNKNVNDTLRNFMTTYRHYGSSMYILTHDDTGGAAPIFRKASRAVHAHQVSSQDTIQAMFKSYGLYLPKSLQAFKDYKDWIARNILDHKCLTYIAGGSRPQYRLFKPHKIRANDFRMYNWTYTKPKRDS
jgi:hypothetical protein